MNLVRTFVAVDVENGEVKAKILELQRKLLSLGIDAKPVQPDNLHLTIRFIGEIEEAKVRDIIAALSTIRLEPFKVQYVGLGVFPSISHINVVWIGIDSESSKNMVSLWEKVEASLEKAGFPSDRRFDPHLTILRIKTGRNREELAAAIRRHSNISLGEDTVSKLKVKKSLLTSNGPIYSDLHVVG
ncbi:MAG: RNA 2',3'-cyclic phosphodiesterase [Nitrososphaeria archaeon]